MNEEFMKLYDKQFIKMTVSGFDVSLLSFAFQDGNYTVVFAPAIQVSGYGLDLSEADKSFEINLEIFLQETVEKNSLSLILEKSGWIKRYEAELEQFKPPAKPVVLADQHIFSEEPRLFDKQLQLD